jgi:hypothetical protein
MTESPQDGATAAKAILERTEILEYRRFVLSVKSAAGVQEASDLRGHTEAEKG